MSPLVHQVTLQSIMVVVDGEPTTVQRSHANFEKLRHALYEQRWDDVPGLLTVAQTIEQWADGDFTVVGGHVVYQGEQLPPALDQRILKMVTQAEDPRCLMRFWERLQQNPSYRSVNQLYAFLMKHPGIPITPDGHILFYKGVRNDFRDCHSGKFDNSPGQTPFMKRNRVSDDPTKACHFGFHVGSRQYASGFTSGKVVICKVDPADVVCVPNDCNQAKIRIHRYHVIGVDTGELLSGTTFDDAGTVPAAKPTVDAKTGEPPVDPNEPLVADAKRGLHTDGTPLQEGETAPAREGQGTVLPLTGTDWDYMNDLNALELLALRIMALRGYARFNCLIVGASKMRGGKEVLVPAIVKARGYGDPADRPGYVAPEDDADDTLDDEDDDYDEDDEECDECGLNIDDCDC